ncbi:dephospho-CoA kinase [Stakelama saccharophila]|uniref:Dephospho-CoA kinase n=1 Tax=Stakelama saccharophila TaxID=3075605 RepID=A0ABZ0B9N1_9SPHN|nr:dephospho-CoA kinase [Stakelama sp. W311]WNO54000.1 dephospho-CoA kinase [Stakelama sp. W311]
MIRLGLTGSIGMGKSTVAAMFAAEGVPVFDADAAVHRLQGPGGAVLPAIESAFPGTTGAAGVDRTALGAAVFGDPEALRRLEAIMHPAVAAERDRFVTEHAGEPLVALDIPLLFETGSADTVDAIVTVSAPAEVQRARVLARPGMTPERFAAILAKQMPDAEKRRRSDHVIDTGVDPARTREAVRRLIACLVPGSGE